MCRTWSPQWKTEDIPWPLILVFTDKSAETGEGGGEEKPMGSGHSEKKHQWEVFVLGRGANVKWLFWEETPMGGGYPRKRNQ